MANPPIDGAASSQPSQPGLMDMLQGTYDPYSLMGPSAAQYHQMFDPSGAEAAQRTASFLSDNPGATPMPWATQGMQGAVSGSDPGFDTSGQPIQAGAPPAYSQFGGSGGAFPNIFSPRAPSTGWFNLQDYYRGAPAEPDNPQAQSVPQNFMSGSNLPSTNDWRLLPPEYRSPNYFQINGQIIDRNLANIQGSPAGHGSYMGAESGPVSQDVNRGSLGIGGAPRVFWNGWNARSGYLGQLGGQSQWGTDIS